MVVAYYEIGRLIVDEEQDHTSRQTATITLGVY